MRKASENYETNHVGAGRTANPALVEYVNNKDLGKLVKSLKPRTEEDKAKNHYPNRVDFDADDIAFFTEEGISINMLTDRISKVHGVELSGFTAKGSDPHGLEIKSKNRETGEETSKVYYGLQIPNRRK